MENIISEKELKNYIDEINKMSIEEYNLLAKRSYLTMENMKKKEIQNKINAIKSKDEFRKINGFSAFLCYSASIGLAAAIGYAIPTGETAKIIASSVSGYLAGQTLGMGALFAYMTRPLASKFDEARIKILKDKLNKLPSNEQKKYIHLTQEKLDEISENALMTDERCFY